MDNVRRWQVFVGRVAIGVIAVGAMVLASSPIARAQEQNEGDDRPTMNSTLVYAEVLLKGFGDCPAELYVNDIPITRAGGTQMPFESMPVPEFIVDGENSLTLVICTGPTPSSAKTAATCEFGSVATDLMEATARIARLDINDIAEPGAGETLLELKWNGADGDSLPKIITAKGDIGPQLGPWAWQSAEPLTLDDYTRKSATEFIDKIRTAYEKADPEPLIAYGKIKNEEAGRTYPEYDHGFFEEMVREQLGEMKDDPAWKPSDLSADDYDLRLVADGRMIEAIAKDWMPILRMADNDFRLRMLIGRVGGEWQIMR